MISITNGFRVKCIFCDLFYSHVVNRVDLIILSDLISAMFIVILHDVKIYCVFSSHHDL